MLSKNIQHKIYNVHYKPEKSQQCSEKKRMGYFWKGKKEFTLNLVSGLNSIF